MGNLSLANWFDTTQLTTEQLTVLYWASQQQAFVHQLYEIVTLMSLSMWSCSPSSKWNGPQTLPIVSLLVNVKEGL